MGSLLSIVSFGGVDSLVSVGMMCRPPVTQISVSTWKSSTILKRPQKRPSSTEKLGTLWIALAFLALVVGLALGAVGGLFFLRLKSR